MCGHFFFVSKEKWMHTINRQLPVVAFVSLNEDVCVQIPLLVLRKSVLIIDSSVSLEGGSWDIVNRRMYRG